MDLRTISLVGLLSPLAAFAQNPEILINPQGWAQHDLSIRGSSYTGTGISINGLNLKAPYSAHFNSELPIPGYLLAPSEARSGLGNVSGHLVGTAAYETVPQASRLQTDASIGTKEHYASGISAFSSGIGGFVEGEKARRIDSNANNLDRYASGAFVQAVTNGWQLDLIGVHQQKEFSTQGYYGIGIGTQKLEDSLLFLGATRGELDGSFFRASAALRELDINAADSRFATAAVEGRTMEIQNIALNLRGDVEHESVENSDRTRGSVLILPQFTYERFKLTAGLNSVFQTSESAEWLPAAGVDWFTTDNSTVYASYSETVQQPDFQTLENNPALQQQRAQNTELGFRQFVSASLDWRAAAFHRQVEHASDWVANTATNLGTLNVDGLEAEISYYPSNELEIKTFYQWVHKDNDVTDGLYETDYPEHVLAFSGHWAFAPQFDLFGAQTLRDQTDNTARNGGDFGASASLGLHWFPRFAHSARLTFLVDNLWGSDFQAIPGLKPPGRTVSTGITVIW